MQVMDKKKIIFPIHPLTNIKISKYYPNNSTFNRVFSKDNLPNLIKNVGYVINLNEYEDTGIHWVALFCNKKQAIYFGSFRVEHVPEEI